MTALWAAAYHMPKDGTLHEDLGADTFDRGARLAQTTRLAGRLQSLGYTVKITPMAA